MQSFRRAANIGWMLPLCLTLALAGCGGPSGPPKHRVTGTVQFDGKPLPSGDITFRPIDGAGIPAGGKIADGRYSLEVAVGNYRVEITAGRETGQKGPYGEAVIEQYIPEKYNSQSEQKAEVQAKGPNTFDFTLEKQPSGG